ncbi:MAG TPA: PD-(D/E)XK nuclease family protein, partial [Candidatus Methylacidiphilales bacterium]|nr:PD-(D/E)XK nuclease family protein [Candidatus Methylacidiphilales bacterium]
TLVDDLGFLARHLESDRDKNDAQAVAEFLRARIALPPEETFARFLDLVRWAVGLRGWEPLLAMLEAEPPEWLRKGKAVLSRRAFLEWLREANESQARTRGGESNHFYGRVHLLVYGQLGGQAWSHLILTGLNEGVWPRVFEAGAFGSRHELAALNQQARALNRRVRGEGRQGEGQEIVREGYGHCLLPLERQDLALRDLCAALESTTHAVCLAAMTTEGGRGLLPSDFFNHAHHVATGRALDEETFRRVANATAAWCREHDFLFETERESPAVPIEETRLAHEARRDATRPFGAHEFAYDVPPERPIQLWCKRWEDAWNHPATVWLESVVGAGAWPEGTLSWPRAIGTWVHDWLAQALRESRESDAAALVPLVQNVAERTARRVRERAAEREIELYPWWEQVWAQARSVAVGLAENLEPVVRGRRFEVEYRLPPGRVAALPGSPLADFELKGRIDLLLFPPGEGNVDPTAESFPGTPCWVVDFKTGSAKALKAKDVARGLGLQSLLYAMAMRSLGAGPTVFSLLTRNAVLKEQVDLDAALQDAALFRSLEIMHRAGIFGMRADAENEYGFSPAYPLATRFIPKYILEAKWARVHGGLPVEEEDDA